MTKNSNIIISHAHSGFHGLGGVLACFTHGTFEKLQYDPDLCPRLNFVACRAHIFQCDSVAVKKNLTKAEFAKTLGHSTTYINTTSAQARKIGITTPKMKRQSSNCGLPVNEHNKVLVLIRNFHTIYDRFQFEPILNQLKFDRLHNSKLNNNVYCDIISGFDNLDLPEDRKKYVYTEDLFKHDDLFFDIADWLGVEYTPFHKEHISVIKAVSLHWHIRRHSMVCSGIKIKKGLNYNDIHKNLQDCLKSKIGPELYDKYLSRYHQTYE